LIQDNVTDEGREQGNKGVDYLVQGKGIIIIIIGKYYYNIKEVRKREREK
jgi:hypothetical protein